MKKFFSMEGKFFNGMTKLANLLWLNILLVICCIPVVTAGAAITAMYSVTLPMTKDEEGYITRSFFKAFKSNFFQATAMWLIILAGAAVLLLDVHIVGNYLTDYIGVMLIPMCFIFLVLVALYLYAFPLQAYFKNTIRGTLGNALKLALVHLPYTIVFVLLQVMPWVVIAKVSNPGLLVAFGWGIAGIAYISSFAYRGIFQKYESAPETENGGQDDENEVE